MFDENFFQLLKSRPDMADKVTIYSNLVGL